MVTSVTCLAVIAKRRKFNIRQSMTAAHQQLLVETSEILEWCKYKNPIRSERGISVATMQNDNNSLCLFA
jgi:hypothetical protein